MAVETIVQRLEAEYGSPRHNNPDDAMDDLAFIVLSQMTTQPSFDRVYARLKALCPSWNDLLTISLDELTECIADAGLSGQKAPRLKRIAELLHADFGRVSLDPLQGMSDEAAEAYLSGLPGVGVKTAKCVLMYALGRQVLPADTHVSRVAVRLAIASGPSGSSRLHREVETAVPPQLRYSFHVNALAHGRAVCRALSRRCEACVLRDLCPSADNKKGAGHVQAQPPSG